MVDYRFGHSLETLHEIAAFELTQHIEKCAAEAAMWNGLTPYLNEAAHALRDRIDKVGEHWRDPAFWMLEGRVRTSIDGVVGVRDAIASSSLYKTFNDDLPALIRSTQDRIRQRYADYQTQRESFERNGQVLDKRPFEEAAGMALNELAIEYLLAGQAVRQLTEKLKWVGPRAHLPEVGPGGPVTDPGAMAGPNSAGSGVDGGSGAVDPASVPDPASAPDPSPTDPTTNPQDEANTLLEQGSEALSALSQAIESLGGTGSGVPDPVTSPVGGLDPADLAAMSPAEYADYLDRMGYPRLAAGGIGDGGPVGMTGVSPVANQVPFGGSNGTTLPSGLPSATGIGAGSTGPGAIPPMYPPSVQRANTGSGIMPGAAEQAGPGSPRKRTPGGIPGVSLSGRAGRAGPAKGGSLASPSSVPPSPSSGAPQQWWETENATGQVLDEELWQVNQQDRDPRYRTGH
ncbi:hypothetical protein GCM10027290_55160 [Micromonospora sonneratiae]|uniref:PPE family protein n=1 Tax=Micromonospora sonneratiae TaxID=1184706 RepID=A0ABW3YN77_9ACTN